MQQTMLQEFYENTDLTGLIEHRHGYTQGWMENTVKFFAATILEDQREHGKECTPNLRPCNNHLPVADFTQGSSYR